MKKLLIFLLYSLITEGELVSVTEGDSVTLHTGFNEIQKNAVIEWRFGALLHRIARMKKGNDPSIYDDVLNGTFRGRLKLNSQNGDLTITNMKTTDTGIYKVSNSIVPLDKLFTVTVVSYTVGERQSVSVLLGESVTLNTDATDIQKYDLIQWKFEQNFIANISRMFGNISTSDGADGKFRHKLQLEYLTGSLTIKNIGNDLSGLYEVDIRSSSKHTIHKTFNVTVCGEMRSLSVMKADSVTLNTYTDLETYDVMLWMFANIFIAEIHKATQLFYTYDGPDERFRNRLKLDHQTGSLTITDITTKHAGIYDLKISSSRHTIHKRISVTVVQAGWSPGAVAGIVSVVLLLAAAVGAFGVIYYRRKISALERKKMEAITVTEECPVCLPSDVTEIQTEDVIQWMFRDEKSPIAKIEGRERNISGGADGRFRDRLQLDEWTGSLTITNTRITDSGDYKLLIIRSGIVSKKSKKFSVTVSVEAKSVTEGGSVILQTKAEIQRDDQMLLLFGEQEICIGQIKGGTEEFSAYDDVPEDRFKGRLELNKKTRSVNITNTSTKDSGLYKLLIIGSGTVTSKIFSVTVSGNTASGRNRPEELPLMGVSNSRL